MNLPNAPKNIIIDYLKKKISPSLIILFGSAAKGTMRPDSDIDIAFLSDKQFTDYELFLIGQGLADVLQKEVDLVDLNKASTVFQAQVVGNGIAIYCNDEKKRMYFEMIVLKKYARLNEERQRIIDNIKERGSIYGH
ncbi:MAG: nucleotidyltransferase domain-containing protein [Bacillota bacterium]|nr:nucleotidyltransferase domain-containing protein [Bacillota bacterium]